MIHDSAPDTNFNVPLHDADPDSNYNFFSSRDWDSCQYHSLNEYHRLTADKNFSILSSNIMSFNTRFDSLSVCFSPVNPPSILCITETRFSSSRADDISGYKAFHTIRHSETPAGGISIYVNNDISPQKIPNLSFINDTIEICSVEIKISNHMVVLLGIYRPHSNTIENFNSLILDLLNNEYLRNKFVIITGDLNICLLKENEPNLNFMNILFAHHFTPLITKATRFPQRINEVPSCLDHIWVNKLYSNVAGILDVDVSDHLPTFVLFNFKLPTLPHKMIQFRLINEENKRKFKRMLSQTDWELIKCQNTDIYAENLVEKINKIYCLAFPLKIKTVSCANYHNPWMTNSLKSLIDAKSNYFRLYKLSMVTLAENNYFRNKVNKVIRAHKNRYYSDRLLACRNDIKKTWKTINFILSRKNRNDSIKSILCNNIIYTDDSDIASIFNDYFCSIGREYDSVIPASQLDPCHFINVPQSSSFFLEPVSPIEISYHIKNLKKSKENINTVSVAMLKDNHDLFSKIFADLVNACFETGTFPKIFKKAIVLPLYKKHDADVLTNYRPISKLPTISKIIEKCIKSRLLRYFTSNNLLNQVQFGFQPGLSTQDAILYLTERLYSNLNSKLSSVAIYIDFSKCFDTLNRSILLKKLKSYGIRGIPLKLFSSYLDERYQSVCVNGVNSDFKLIDTGVPQGSVLGPILYLIYVNDLPNLSDQFTSCLFADDTTLIFENKNQNDLINSCNIGINLFYSWCCANRLSINISKTKSMLFSNILCPLDISEIYMNGTKIEYTSSMRFLGMIMDDKLKFSCHINLIKEKISKNAGVLYRLKQFVPHQTLVSVYRCFVECYLNYCIIVFGNAYQCHINQLEIAQKKCVRIVANQPPLSHTAPIFYELKLLNLSDIYKFNIALYMYKNIDKFASCLQPNIHSTRSGIHYSSQRQWLTLTQNQSIKYQAPKIWNRIPIDIRNSSSIFSFKRKLKNYLISLYIT